MALLSWDLPKDQVAAENQSLTALARRLGEWALLLKLVNGFLRDRAVTNHEPLHQAIAGVNRRLHVKGLTAFEAGRSNAIIQTIGVSLEQLSESEPARFCELAVFPAKMWTCRFAWFRDFGKRQAASMRWTRKTSCGGCKAFPCCSRSISIDVPFAYTMLFAPFCETGRERKKLSPRFTKAC